MTVKIDLVVYTASFGCSKNIQFAPTFEGVQFVLFTDQCLPNIYRGWIVSFVDNKNNKSYSNQFLNRLYKYPTKNLFDYCPNQLYIDDNILIKSIPSYLTSTQLNCDFMAHRHPVSANLRSELINIGRHKRASLLKLIFLAKRYCLFMQSGVSENCIIYRNYGNKNILKYNRNMVRYLGRSLLRDQFWSPILMFHFSHRIRFCSFTSRWRDSEYFEYIYKPPSFATGSFRLAIYHLRSKVIEFGLRLILKFYGL